jgi:TRAP-type mannitol/chloroaromatic compound transport system permease small subunit
MGRQTLWLVVAVVVLTAVKVVERFAKRQPQQTRR